MLKNIIQFELANNVNNDVVHITSYICDICNYECFYCYNNKPRSKRLLNLSRLEKFINMLQQKHKQIEIDFVGGEPTLHPDLIVFADKMKQHYDYVSLNIYTNFSQNTKFYLSLAKLNVRLSLSFHSTTYSNDMQFISKLNDMRDYVYEIHVMLQPKKFKHILNIYRKIINISGIENKVQLHLLNENRNCFNIRYTSQQIDEFEKLINNPCAKKFNVTYDDGHTSQLSEFDVFMNNVNSFKLWKCYVGEHYVYVHYDGNVYPCSTLFNIVKPLCNIYDYSFSTLQLKPILCPIDTCVCNLDQLKQ